MMFTGDYRCSSGGSGGGARAPAPPSPLCAVPGGVNAAAAACSADGVCRAFAYNRGDRAGYLKDQRGVAAPVDSSDLYQKI
jgi:hypothetical protein